jgi:hypothetical protein
MCFDFIYSFVWNISHPKKKWARYDKNMRIGLHALILYSYPILLKLLFSQQIFEKWFEIKWNT